MNKKLFLIILIISILFIGASCTLPKIKAPQQSCCEALNLDGNTEFCFKNVNEIECSSNYNGNGGYNYYSNDCSNINTCANKISCVYNGIKYQEGYAVCSNSNLYQCTNGNIQKINVACCEDADGFNIYTKGGTFICVM